MRTKHTFCITAFLFSAVLLFPTKSMAVMKDYVNVDALVASEYFVTSDLDSEEDWVNDQLLSRGV